MIHIVAQCHEEGLEHYLRSYVKVWLTRRLLIIYLFIYFAFTPKDRLTHTSVPSPHQFVFRTEPYTGNNSRTVHEELAKAMTAILKPSTDFLTSNKLLKVSRPGLLQASIEPVYEDGRRLFFSFFFFIVFTDKCPSVPQYSWYFFEALVKSMAQYLIESCKVKVSISCWFKTSTVW